MLGVNADHHSVNGKEPESTLTKAQVLARDIPWEGYQRAALISDKELELIRRYDKKPDDIRRSDIEKEGSTYAELFLALMMKISNPETLQYVLSLIHDLLVADPRRVDLFNNLAEKFPGYPWTPFIRLISRSEKDYYITKMACAILGVFMSKSANIPSEHADFLLRWIIEHARKPATLEAHIAISTLQTLVLKDDFRVAFFKLNAIPFLVDIIKTQTGNLQLLYETIFCIWMMTYNEEVASNIAGIGLIPALVDVIKTVTKEKIIRLSIASLRNLVDKSTNNEEMIDSGFVRMLAILSNKKWADEDIIDDLKVLSEELAKNIVVLSSFDMYKKELLSGSLEWSPVHKSEKFWIENASRFEENDYQILGLVQKILRTSTDPLTLSVACYDIGEFVRFHPRGKSIVQQLGIKMDIMKLMTHEDAQVKKQALFAIQKMMVHNWEYLSK
jgi:V-type H+-transporting ATPase subunit H